MRLQPFIANFVLRLRSGKAQESDLADHVTELVYELSSIQPALMNMVLPSISEDIKVCHSNLLVDT
jgi:hypothetical protein